MIGITSFTAFNPPDFLHTITMAPLPIMIILSIALRISCLRNGEGRVWAIAGLVITALSVIAFGVMITIGDNESSQMGLTNLTKWNK